MFHNLLIKKALSYDNNNDGVCLGEGGGGGSVYIILLFNIKVI